MNTYFCAICQGPSKKIPVTKNPLLEGKYSVNPEGTKFYFQFDTDCIANYFLNIGLPDVSYFLCNIFNLSIATGAFPDSWKIARFAPIFKNGSTDDQANNKPISVLSVLSRIFGKLIFSQLYK